MEKICEGVAECYGNVMEMLWRVKASPRPSPKGKGEDPTRPPLFRGGERRGGGWLAGISVAWLALALALALGYPIER